MNGLIVNIYRTPCHGDCTNGGVSTTANDALLVGLGVSGPFGESKDRPTLVLIHRQIGGSEYLQAEPNEPCPPDRVGYMFGGNFCYSSDGRFPSKYPIPIHDRSETPEQAERLSR